MSSPNRAIPVSVGRADPDPAADGPAPPAGPGRPSPPAAPRTPPIDIFEEPDGLILLADLPGVAEDSVAIELEDNLLTLRARGSLPVPEGSEPMLEEFPPGAFQRTFILSDEVDRSRISAELKSGVLRLLMPKAERARPRRIEIRGLDGENPAP
ncbi:Hsp20/alpha crystallin family protein [Tautonia plasticadhaerens]|uniref:18 kDa heat shock protein n=1 Tax=Tautonia plasticadhaerens TaxID=2527974 RepID=A0A518GWI9_9BACT|nr:Hsp20/alpha crystallin family protein [Tautonia plasticadhaerens]QDV32965.1 18 kDa heat shock protein [Tautonia plasticadhaerens]